MKKSDLIKCSLAASFLALAACSSPSSEEPVDTVSPSAEISGSEGSGATNVSAAIPHAQLPETIIPSAYRIDMTINPDADGMSGIVEIDAEVTERTDGFWMHAKDMEVSEASITMGEDVIDLTYNPVSEADAPSGLAWFAAAQALPEGTGTIRLNYETPYNQNLNSAYKVVRGEDAYIVTQMEPLGAREAFPGFDEPKYKQTFTVTITAPVGDVVVFNTPKTAEVPIGEDWVRHEFQQTLPLPTYLIAFAVGPYDVVDYGEIPPNDIRSRPLALRGLAARGEGPRLQYALENTDGLLSALEGYFGREYPYEKLDLIAAPDYAFGAMENPGLIVYREYLLLLDENAPLAQKRSYARVHSHELAHQWFGNLVTPVWWEDIWLNEAFATWMGNKGLTLWQPDGNYENVTLNASLGAMNIDTLSSTRAVREPLLRSENVMDQFDGITYRKGGGTLDMFESYVGEEAFQAGVRLHMERYEHDVATADDFFQSVADGSNNPDVVSAMKSFVDQPGLPLVSAEMTCDVPDSRVDATMITLTQSRYAPLGSTTQQGQSWEIPVCLASGLDGERSKDCRLMTERTQTVSLPGCVDWVTLNADGAGYYRFTLPADGWAKLMDNLDQLNTREVLTAQDSLVAAFRAGEVDAETFLSGMTAFADHPNYDVASSSTRLLSFIYEEFPDAREGLAAHIRDTYAKRYRRIRKEDSVEGELLSPTLGDLLASKGDDVDAKNYLLRQGTLLLDLGISEEEQPKRAQVPTNITATAYRETMRQLPKAAYPVLLEQVETGSPLQKSSALSALAATPDPDQASELRELALAEDSPFTGRQSGTILAGLMNNLEHREATWKWFKTNFESYVTRKVPDVRLGGVPQIASGFCSIDKRDEVETFLTERAALIPGYERSLAQTLESIALCAALKEAQGPSLIAALNP